MFFNKYFGCNFRISAGCFFVHRNLPSLTFNVRDFYCLLKSPLAKFSYGSYPMHSFWLLCFYWLMPGPLKLSHWLPHLQPFMYIFAWSKTLCALFVKPSVLFQSPITLQKKSFQGKEMITCQISCSLYNVYTPLHM